MIYRGALGAFLAVTLCTATGDYALAQMPEDHQVEGFIEVVHGRRATTDASTCAICHARDYCTACHTRATTLQPILSIAPASEEEKIAAQRARWKPPSHTPFWLEGHKSLAAAATASCESCHAREEQCFTCHTGSETVAKPGEDVTRYHPLDFLEQHSASAWNRDTECASCHNTEAFCRSCHLDVGRGSAGRTRTGYHNEDAAFVLGHGQAARQGLESCASCHAQSDCLACHSARTGRNINPHGPNFDASRLRDKNRELCLFCHFSSILDR